MATYKVVEVESLEANLKTVADSIRAKGGTSAKLSFPTGMAAAIAAITTGSSSPTIDLSGVTAVAADVLSTKKFMTSGGVLTQGTMVERNAISGVVGANLSETAYTVAAGHHNGSGKVSLSGDIKLEFESAWGGTASTLAQSAAGLASSLDENARLIQQIATVLTTKSSGGNDTSDVDVRLRAILGGEANE